MFENSKLKIERASEQCDDLCKSIESFTESENYVIEEIQDFQTGEKQAIFKVTKEFPSEWPLIIGDIAHNLRSGLDHAIYELTVLESGTPMANTEFPVFEDESKYSAVKKNGLPTRNSGLFKIRGIPDKAQEVIRGLQPFAFQQKRNEGNEPIVAIVHELNIIDKHRTLVLCRRTTKDFFVKVVRDIHPIENVILPIEIKDGIKLARWKPAGRDLDEERDMEFRIGFQVAFGKTVPKLQMSPVIPLCESLVRGVKKILFYLEKATTDT